jgi:hypothetical protein
MIQVSSPTFAVLICWDHRWLRWCSFTHRPLCPLRRILCSRGTGCWVGSVAGPDAVEKGTVLFVCRESNSEDGCQSYNTPTCQHFAFKHLRQKDTAYFDSSVSPHVSIRHGTSSRVVWIETSVNRLCKKLVFGPLI